MDCSDSQLLLRFLASHDEAAFTELVRRYFDLVLSTALRRARGDRPLAQDISQIVFADLARHARTLPSEVRLGGWLHRHTCFIAGKAVRAEIRRRQRETTAATTMHPHSSDPEGTPVTELAAALDESLLALPDLDRQAIVMRYLERRDLRSIGSSLGVSEDTAQKRVARALDKLRVWLEGRGQRASGVSAGLTALLTAPPTEAAGASVVAETSRRSLTLAAATSGAGVGGVTGWFATWPGVAGLSTAAALFVAGPAYWIGAHQASRGAAASGAGSGISAAVPALADAPPPPSSPLAKAVNTVPLKATPELADQLIALTRVSLGNDDGREEALRLIRSLAPSELAALLREIVQRPVDWRLRGTPATMVLSEWARTDPAGAMAHAEGEDTQGRVLQRWLQKDRPAALAWLEEQVTREGTSKRTNHLLRSVTEQLTGAGELPGALSLAGRLTSPGNAADTFGEITRLLDTPADRETVRSAIAAVADPATREQALRGFVGSWANADREGARTWIEAQPRKGRDALVGEFARVWMWVDPAATADWWVAHSIDTREAIRGAMESWRPEQINDAGAWLQRQGLGPEADEGLATFARTALLEDPSAALTWAGIIADPALRQSTTTGLFQTWIEHDRTAAEAFLSQARLPEETKSQLRARLARP